jgi:hypothetical protein
MLQQFLQLTFDLLSYYFILWGVVCVLYIIFVCCFNPKTKSDKFLRQALLGANLFLAGGFAMYVVMVRLATILLESQK